MGHPLRDRRFAQRLPPPRDLKQARQRVSNSRSVVRVLAWVDDPTHWAYNHWDTPHLRDTRRAHEMRLRQAEEDLATLLLLQSTLVQQP